MSITLDGLQIEITENSDKAVAGLESLIRSLEKLKRTTSGFEKSLDGVNFEKFANQMKKLSTALQPLQGFKTQAAGVLSALRNFKTTAEEFNQFTGFDRFSEQIKLLANSLQPLSGVGGKLGATLNALSQVTTISEQLEAVDYGDLGNKITELANSFTPLGNLSTGFGATLGNLARFSQIAQQLDTALKETDLSKNILDIIEALKPLGDIGKSNLNSVLNQLRKLPEISKELAGVDLEAFAKQIERVTAVLKPLANEMEKISAGFAAFPIRIKKVIEQNHQFGGGLKLSTLKAGGFIVALRRLVSMSSEWIESSNAYVENLNLFRISMGEAADEALDFAYKVRDAFGIDPSEWIRFQAVFQNMATGFGITSEKAQVMSKNLTQLGYDLATIFNVDYSIAMEKLQSAIAGQPRPMREWGFDMSEATLKLVAMKLGIEENVETMTQYEKAQLRFIQLMDTARKQGILGNFARELVTPANAMRILNQQIEFLKRSLGNLLIPILMKIIPYLQAIVVVITDIVNELANLMGFTLPKIDYSNLEGLSSNIATSVSGLEDADEAAKKLLKTLMPFDEINLLGETDTDALAVMGTGFDLDLSKYNYDFLTDSISNQVDAIVRKLKPAVKWVKENLDKILEVAKGIAAAFAAWKISGLVLDGLNFLNGLDLFKGTALGEKLAGMNKLKMATGLTLTITGIFLEFTGAKAIGAGEAQLMDYIKTALGAVLGVAGSLLIFGTGPVGWTVGIGIAITTFITGVTIGANEKLAEMVKQTFYQSGDGITISDVLVRFEKITLDITEDMDTVIKGGEVIRKLEDDVRGIVKSIEKSSLWGTIEELQSLFNNLQLKTKKILDEIYNNIIESIGGAFGQALIEAGYHIPDVIKALTDIRDKGMSTIESIYKQMEDLNEDLAIGKIEVADYKEQYNKLYKQMTKLIDLETDTSRWFRSIREEIGNINWEDLNPSEAGDKVKEVISSISKTSQEATRKVEEYFKNTIDNLKNMRKFATTDEERSLIDDLIIKATTAKESSLNQVKANTKEVFDILQQDIILKSGDVMSNATKEWESGELSFWEYVRSKTPEAYAHRAAESYSKNIVNPLDEAIEEAMKTLGIQGSTYSKETMKSIIWDLFSTDIFSPVGQPIYNFKKGLNEETRKLFEQYGIDGSEWAKRAGLDIASEAGKGLVKGIQDQKKPVEDAFGEFEKSAEKTTGEIKKTFEKTKFPLKLPKISWDWDNAIEPPGIVKKALELLNLPVKIPKLKIDYYAAGGFPTTGELFVAREAGPELVGTIGGKAAVAANDDIVEGISQGVFEAVTMAMRANSGSSGSGDIVVNLDGRTIARMQLNKLNEEAQRLGYAPILRYQEGRV